MFTPDDRRVLLAIHRRLIAMSTTKEQDVTTPLRRLLSTGATASE